MNAVYRVALTVAAFVFLLPLSARSGIREGSIEATPFGGYNFFQDKQNLKDRPEFGGRLGYNFTSNFGIEGAVEFIRSRVNDKTLTNVKEGQFASPVDSVKVTFYHVDAVYHFMPDSQFTPFVVAGIGGAHYSPKNSDHDMAALNVGVGAKYWVTDRIAIRGDLRDYIVTEVFQETYHNLGATVGVTFAFGGRAEPVPVAAKTPEPKAAAPVVVLVSEPKVEEKVAVLAAEPKIEEKVVVLALEDIHFDFDKSTLTPEAQAILKRNIEILKANPKAKVRIAGYTSASGTDEYNQKLSERRANAVKEYLVKENVASPGRLSEIGYGEARPAMYEAAPERLYSTAAKANMRVLFEITVK